MFNKSFYVILSAVVFLSASSGFASEAAGGTSEATHSTVIDSMYINLFTVYHGPSMTQVDSPYTVNAEGTNTGNLKRKTGMYFDSDLTADYLITSRMGVGATVPFFYTVTQGQDMTLGDAGVNMFYKPEMESRNLHVYTNIKLQAPTSDYSRLIHQTFGFKTTPYVRYDLPGSRFTVGAWSEAKYYLGAEKVKGISTVKTFKTYLAPYVSYQLMPKLALNLEYEMENDHMDGNAPLDFTGYQSDLCPGVVYMITPKILINPYLQIFTTDHVALDRTALGAVITATL